MSIDGLIGIIFMGKFCGRRLHKGDYHDLIVIQHEEPIIKQLGVIKTSSYLPQLDGIKHCLFVELTPGTPLGAYWMQAVGVHHYRGHKTLQVSCLRTIPDHLYSGTTSSTKNNPLDGSFDADNFIENLKTIPNLLAENMNLHGIINVVRFIFVLLITMVVGSYHFVIFIGYFTLRLLGEVNLLIDRLTPIFLGMLDFCGKAVGGFYIVLASLMKSGVPNDQRQQYVELDQRPYNIPQNSRSNRNVPVDHID